MKVVIINGSYRKEGATAIILKEIQQNLMDYTNIEVQFINVADLQLRFCTGCCSCYSTGSSRKVNQLYKDLQNKRSYRIQRICHSLIFNLGLRPFIMKKGEKYNGVVRHWNTSHTKVGDS